MQRSDRDSDLNKECRTDKFQMVLAYHVILSAYGFWLPNDPRGSWSEFVGAYELFLAGGKATKVDHDRSVAHVAHDRERRLKAKQSLKYKPVRFRGKQACAIARGFADTSRESAYTVYACSILPDHAHLVIGRTDRSIRQVAGHFKARASQQVEAEGFHPFTACRDRTGRLPSMWAERSWDVFVDSQDYFSQAIRYVENNPLKHGLKRQSWSFVQTLEP